MWELESGGGMLENVRIRNLGGGMLEKSDN